MCGLKLHQPSMSVVEQIDNLKELGLIVNDYEYAEKILNDISYFRLIKAYSLNLKTRNGNYKESVTFEQLVDLYLFDAEFRQLLFPIIEKIEINTRCRISSYFADKYGVLGYKERTNFNNYIDNEQYSKFINDINHEVDRSFKSPFVRNFKENYVDGDLPMYAIVEVFSFGHYLSFIKI